MLGICRLLQRSSLLSSLKAGIAPTLKLATYPNDSKRACPLTGRSWYLGPRRRGTCSSRSAGASGHSISWLPRRWCHFLAACPIPSLSWKEMDSNYRSLLRRSPVSVAEGELRDRTGAAHEELFLLPGTDGSNPSPSSREMVWGRRRRRWHHRRWQITDGVPRCPS